MSGEKIRIAIAEAVGWRPHPDNAKRPLEERWWTLGGAEYGDKDSSGKYLVASYNGSYEDPEETWSSNIDPLPKYDCDLNAIHEAEKSLTEKHWNKYVVMLARTIAGTFDSNVKVSVPTNVLISANAKHRAEAFLRTLNIWKN